MKIVTKTKFDGELCYVQVKDYLALARITKNDSLMNMYLSFINNGRGDNDFVKVNNSSYAMAFSKCEGIVNYAEFSKANPDYMSSLLVSMNGIYPQSEFESEILKYKCDGLRDIMYFKRGEADYTLPIVPSGEVEIEDERFLFTASQLVDWYVLRNKNGEKLEEYDDFLNTCINQVISDDADSKDERYRQIDKGNTMYVNVLRTPVKRKNVIGSILSKIKKVK